ncbi:hypothetical protein VTK73DRAFT_10158 [Phialemonium thermophilum]|uniref:Isochorismatase-like domain-containing protein n=1 Tax=Phialemonium thermophilum TaxID=223376 RepID=A0ABR3XHY6_9PEZI
MSSKLVFGPAGDQWHYDKPTKTYDLTRGAAKAGAAFTMRTSQGIPGTSVTVEPNLCALVVVDMQNFFLHPSCRDHPNGLAAVEPTLRIIWLNWGLTDDDLAFMPAAVQRGFSRSLIISDPSSDPTQPVRAGLGADLGSGKGRCLVAGTWNAALYQPLAEEAQGPGLGVDVHCAKNRLSGMWSTEQPLYRYLEGREQDGDLVGEKGSLKRTLFFAGVNTDQCVQATLVDAYNAGWDCVLLEDCCGTPTRWGKEVCLYNTAGSYGFVVDSQAFVAGKQG